MDSNGATPGWHGSVPPERSAGSGAPELVLAVRIANPRLPRVGLGAVARVEQAGVHRDRPAPLHRHGEDERVVAHDEGRGTGHDGVGDVDTSAAHDSQSTPVRAAALMSTSPTPS